MTHTVNDLEDTVDEIPTDDEHTTLYNPQIIDLDNDRPCLQCKARVEPQTPPLGKCTKEECLMIQLHDLCQEQITVRVMLRHVNNEGEYSHITCSAYGDLVYQLANMAKNHPLTKSDILKHQKLHEIQIFTGKNIVTFVLHKADCQTIIRSNFTFCMFIVIPIQCIYTPNLLLYSLNILYLTSISHSSFTQYSFTVTHTASLDTMLRSCYYLQH